MAWITVREAARRLKRSQRTLYTYLSEGKLYGARGDHSTLLDEEEVRGFVPSPPGRQRTVQPLWHEPVDGNALSLMTVTVPLCPGQQACFREQLRRLRIEQSHLFAGTVARYITDEQDDSHCIEILLIWRACLLPSAEDREAALVALREDFAGVLDWQHASVVERGVLLHAS